MTIEFTQQRPDELSIVQQTAQFFVEQQQQAYLVGGSVRDLLLNEICTDWDIATTGDAPKLARKLANRLNGFYAHLHEKASRVICKQAGHEFTFDIAPLQSGTIEEDLRLRDFTINAIALPLNFAAQTCAELDAFIDPLGGVADLRARHLRAVHDDIFRHDPLRLLRAARFMMRYRLTLDPTSERMLTRDAPLLTLAAPERIREELYALLRPASAAQRLRFLDQHGIFTTLLPEFIPARGMRQPDLHYWDVLEHSIEAVATLERLSAELQRSTEDIGQSALEHGGNLAELQSLLREAEQQDLFQFATLSNAPMKLAALLHDIGKPITHTVDEDGTIRFYHHPQAGVPLAREILRRLSASTQDQRLVQQVVAHHMRPGQLSGTATTPRALRRFFVDLGHAGIYVALVSLADHLAMRGPEPLTSAWARHLATVRLLLKRYVRERESILPPRIIQPGELIRRFNLGPGPLIGQLLEHIAEAQSDGQIRSKDDALWLAEEFLQTH